MKTIFFKDKYILGDLYSRLHLALCSITPWIFGHKNQPYFASPVLLLFLQVKLSRTTLHTPVTLSFPDMRCIFHACCRLTLSPMGHSKITHQQAVTSRASTNHSYLDVDVSVLHASPSALVSMSPENCTTGCTARLLNSIPDVHPFLGGALMIFLLLISNFPRGYYVKNVLRLIQVNVNGRFTGGSVSLLAQS